MPNIKPKSAIIAVDIGTGSTRSLLVDDQLNILTVCSENLNQVELHSGWMEQDPLEAVEATFRVMRQSVLAAKTKNLKIEGVCFSCAVSSLMALDENSEILTGAMMWADTRSSADLEVFIKDSLNIYQRTGCPVHSSYWPSKLLWMRRVQPGTFLRAKIWLTIKDYLVWRLTGEFITDYSNAAATGMLNLTDLDWDEQMMALVGITVEKFLPVRPTTHIIPGIEPHAAALLNLDQSIPVILGAGDGVLSSLGSGTVQPGTAITMIGSSGACRTISNKPIFNDPACRLWSYPLLDNLWVVAGAENSGGLVVDWFIKNISGIQTIPGSDNPYDSIMAMADTIPAGSEGLIFLPYLLGERAPIWDPHASGAFIGLKMHHTPAHMARAVLESTVFALYSIYEALNENVIPIHQIRASGGYTRSLLWLQIQADMFNRDLHVMANHEGSALGAAILGLYATGRISSLQAVARNMHVAKVIHPNPEFTKIYSRLTPVMHNAYQQLKPVFAELSCMKNPIIENPENL